MWSRWAQTDRARARSSPGSVYYVINFFSCPVYSLVLVNQSGGMGRGCMGHLLRVSHYLTFVITENFHHVALLGLPCRTALLRISVDRQRALALGAPLWLGSSIFLRCFEAARRLNLRVQENRLLCWGSLANLVVHENDAYLIAS